MLWKRKKLTPAQEEALRMLKENPKMNGYALAVCLSYVEKDKEGQEAGAVRCAS